MSVFNSYFETSKLSNQSTKIQATCYRVEARGLMSLVFIVGLLFASLKGRKAQASINCVNWMFTINELDSIATLSLFFSSVVLVLHTMLSSFSMGSDMAAKFGHFMNYLKYAHRVYMKPKLRTRTKRNTHTDTLIENSYLTLSVWGCN